MDYVSLAGQLLARGTHLLSNWLPGGRRIGHEFVCGSLAGLPGRSLSINLNSGIWKDFQSGEGGGDLVSLYAAIKGLTQSAAARELTGEAAGPAPVPRCAPPALAKPNGQAADFTGEHARLGLPSALYPYRDAAGEVLFFIARYETTSGKQIRPWVYTAAGWVNRAYPAPRPLFGLELLAEHPQSPVLIVEGEKCALAARRLIKPSVRVTISWCGGASAVGQADWTWLAHRAVMIWPDADEAGWRAGAEVAERLVGVAASVQVIDTHGLPEAWDIADAIARGDSAAQLAAFAREHACSIEAFTAPLAAPEGAGAPIDSAAPPDSAQLARAAPASSRALVVSANASADTALPSFTSEVSCWQHYGLAMGPNGRPWPNLDNCARVFEAVKLPFWYDSFRDLVMIGQEELTAARVLNLTLMLQAQIFLPKVSKECVFDACVLAAQKTPRHPVRAFLEGLPGWDGQGRASHWLTQGLGAEDSEYTRSVARNFLVALIARVYEPGCQVDTMPVLEGSQGVGKTGALRILAGGWYRTTSASMGEKDFLQGLRGCWVLEIAELDSVGRASLERVKAILSTPVDEYFARYGRVLSIVPRQCVFAGTTNSSVWNADDTGARRFWPIECRAGPATRDARLAALRDAREQLFAEALHLYRSAHRWHEVPIDAATREQQARHVDDPWMELIAQFVQALDRVTVLDVMRHLDIDSKDLRSADAYRVSRILQSLQWRRKRSKTERFYVPPVLTPSDPP